LVLLMFVAFNVFLVFVYVAHFGEADGREAHSYFRYNSHLSLLMMLALTLGGRELIGAERIALWPLVRFDLAMPQPVLWDLSKTFAERLKDGERVAVVAPGDNGTLLLSLKGYLALTQPRRSELDLVLMAEPGAEALDGLARRGFDKAIVTCAAAIGLDSDAPEAVLLERGADGWTITLRQRYRIAVGKDWMAQFPTEPFCGSRQLASLP
jgi:hypothetical protein